MVAKVKLGNQITEILTDGIANSGDFMKRQNLLLVILVFYVVFPAGISSKAGPEKTNGVIKPYSYHSFSVPEKNKVEMLFCYSFFVPGETTKIKLVVALPRTIAERQKIHRIEFFPKPSRRFTSRNGNQYAEFIITEPKRWFDVEIKVNAELFRCDLSTKLEKYDKKFVPRDELRQFTDNENAYLIREIAAGINSQSEIKMVKDIYDYVVDNMEYSIYKGEGGAAYAALQKSGDCSEYADLFVALCRAKGIPARVVIGYVVEVDDEDDLPKHAWAEVYLEDYGWVQFDPTWGDNEKPWLREILFHTMKPIYIHTKYPDKDEVIDDIGDVMYWRIGDDVEMKKTLKFEKWELHRPALKVQIPETRPKTTYGVVGGIMYSEDNPLAIIDGKILKEGGTIHKVRIIRIYETEVKFEKNGLSWTQKVGETANRFWQ